MCYEPRTDEGLSSPDRSIDSSVADFNFDQRAGEIDFNIEADMPGSCKVIVSKWLLDGAFNFLIDNAPAACSINWSPTYRMVKFSYNEGTHRVKIVGECVLRYDLNGDRRINIIDIALIAKQFGKELEGP